MILQIPVSLNDFEEAKITTFNERKYWLIVELENGHTKCHNFYDNAKDIKDTVDYVVIKNKEEDVEEFLDYGIDVLIAPLQIYAEDVVEAYMFRELHEL